MSPLREPHSLWATVHIAAPFVLLYETGSPRVSFALVFLWEIVEWVIFTTMGHYGPLFLNHPTYESLWDVWALDIGGGIFGILLGMSFHYFDADKTTREAFWRPFVPTPKGRWWVRTLRYLGFGLAIMASASFGWHCIDFFPDLCVDGYHYLPWGVFVMAPLFVAYACWVSLPKLSYSLVLLFVPVLFPVTKETQPVSASFVQFVMISSVSTFAFVGTVIDRWRSTGRYIVYSEL